VQNSRGSIRTTLNRTVSEPYLVKSAVRVRFGSGSIRVSPYAELPKFPNPRVDLYFGPPPQLPPHVVWPSGAVEPQGKVSKCFIIDFLTITDPFFTIIGYSLLIYANGMISRAPLLTALHFRSYPRSLFLAILNADGTLSSGEGIISDNVISDLFAPPQPPSSMTTWLTP